MSFCRAVLTPLVVLCVAASFGIASAAPVDVLAGTTPRMNVRNGNRARVVKVRGQEFGRAIRLDTTGEKAEWHAQVLAATTDDLAEGDVFCVRLWMRAVDVSKGPDDLGRAVVHFHNGDSGKTGLLVRSKLSVGTEWKQYVVPFAAPVDAAAGESELMLNFNRVAQTLFLGPVTITNYGPDYPIEKLTEGLETYDGQQADAPWRRAAAARIQKYRTGPLKVRVVDVDGEPVADADVAVEMRRHAFPFGSAVSTELVTLPENEFPLWTRRGTHSVGDARRYREIVTENFTRITPEGALRPRSFRMHRDWKNQKHKNLSRRQALAYDNLAAFSAEHEIEIRGHCLSWGALNSGPWKEISGTRGEYRAAMTDIMRTVPPAVGDLVVEWDTLNHPCGWGRSLEDLFGGLDMHVELMELARENTPPGVLHYVNEGNVITDLSRIPDYERIIKHLIENGQAPDGIGMMGHFGRNTLTGMDKAWGVLERFAGLAPRLQITELDVSAPGEERLQADYLRDIMTLCFSHPKMAGIVMWGFWEGHHWKPETALWRKDWTIKPAGEAWLKLVKEDWWTDQTVTTDADGLATVPHAFYGDYEISADGRGVAARHEADSPAAVTIVVD